MPMAYWLAPSQLQRGWTTHPKQADDNPHPYGGTAEERTEEEGGADKQK